VTAEPGDEHHRRDDDASMPVVMHRLGAIERRLDEQAKAQALGFAEVARQIAGLTFVRADVYAANQETAAQIHAELAKDIVDGDATLADKVGDLSTQLKLLWSVVGATVIAGLIGVLFEIAGRS
jgi:hypothetical protein